MTQWEFRMSGKAPVRLHSPTIKCERDEFKKGPLFLTSSKTASSASRNISLVTSPSLKLHVFSKNVTDTIRCYGSSLILCFGPGENWLLCSAVNSLQVFGIQNSHRNLPVSLVQRIEMITKLPFLGFLALLIRQTCFRFEWTKKNPPPIKSEN